jgi:hypothetical protein
MDFGNITIPDAIALFIGLAGTYLALRKTPIEIGKLQADASRVYIDAARELAEELRTVQAELRQAREELETCGDDCQDEERKARKFKEYAELLAHQLRSHRITPEPLIENGHEDLPASTPIPTKPRKPKTRGEDHA